MAEKQFKVGRVVASARLEQSVCSGFLLDFTAFPESAGYFFHLFIHSETVR